MNFNIKASVLGWEKRYEAERLSAYVQTQARLSHLAKRMKRVQQALHRPLKLERNERLTKYLTRLRDEGAYLVLVIQEFERNGLTKNKKKSNRKN